jgi:hypothetical protein
MSDTGKDAMNKSIPDTPTPVESPSSDVGTLQWVFALVATRSRSRLLLEQCIPSILAQQLMPAHLVVVIDESDADDGGAQRHHQLKVRINHV